MENDDKLKQVENEVQKGGEPDEVEMAGRRRFLRSLGKWSMAVIGAIASGAATPTEGAAWINRRGGWLNRGGGGWTNRAGSWLNGGGGGWANRSHGGGWLNNRGGGGWLNRRW
jgi:hypothetical protein